MSNYLIDPTQDRRLGKQERLAFLAGPVQGAPDWQQEAAPLLHRALPKLIIATPRVPSTIDKATFDYTAQTGWEKDRLKRAGELGGILFWFAARDFALPYREGRAYAQTTRMELSRVVGWMDKGQKLPIAIGVDPNYRKNGGGNERYIRGMAAEHAIPVQSTLPTTVDYLVRSFKELGLF